MAKILTTLMLATYTTDFDTSYNNVFVKWTTEAPIPEGFYLARTAGCGANSLPFRMRYLKAKFPEGIHQYPVPDLANIIPLASALRAEGATCIDLVGEQWSAILPSILNNPTFRATPYAAADITGAGDKTSGSYDYASDAIAADARISYSLESVPTALLTAQRAAMTNPTTARGTPAKSLKLKPRHFVIKADVDDGTTIARKAIVSDVGVPDATAMGLIAGAANTLSYYGESLKGLEGLAPLPTP